MPDVKNILPKKKFLSYLKKFDTSSIEEMNSNKITQVFLLLIHDFKTGDISLDELCAMGEKLLFRIKLIETNTTETKHALERLYDLYYDLRIIQDKLMAKTFIQNLVEVLDFYDKYEYIIKSILPQNENIKVIKEY